MPPPSFCSKDAIQSMPDHESDNETNYENIICERENKPSIKSETVGIVKSFLGPTLEDAVYKTLQFGRTLIQKSEEIEQEEKYEKLIKKSQHETASRTLDVLLEEKNKQSALKNLKHGEEGKRSKKSILIYGPEQLEEQTLNQKTSSSIRKLSNLSKIRSLDSDLKKNVSSPEKIKRQLEALIQIHKDEPPDQMQDWDAAQHKVLTVMPSLCVYKKEEVTRCSSTESQNVKTAHGSVASTSRSRSSKKRIPSKICQAPEMISNALGPTLDVTIMDNLKMMRDIFKNDTGKGEGSQIRPATPEARELAQKVQLQSSEEEMCCRIEKLQKKIEELQQKEENLTKQIEEEERERDLKRKAFEAEEKKLCEKKSTDTCGSIMEKKKQASLVVLDSKLECLQMKINNEEEKLMKLKCQHDQYKRELAEAKNKCEALKRNKALLDAWDVFASRVCHTRLPSFSRAGNLERKQYKAGDFSNLHCCFPPMLPASGKKTSQCRSGGEEPCRSCSASRCVSTLETSENRSAEAISHQSPTSLKCKVKQGEIQFPIQRDVICGLHQIMKTCACSKMAPENPPNLGPCPFSTVPPAPPPCLPASSEENLFKKYRACQGDCHANAYPSDGLESHHAEFITDTPHKSVEHCRMVRSKSETSLKEDRCSKIVKVMWAVARINVFQNNYRTYEIMDATCRPPVCMPAKTEGIFVVKTQHKKSCPPGGKKKKSSRK